MLHRPARPQRTCADDEDLRLMETRANHVLIGSFALAVLVLAFLFAL